MRCSADSVTGTLNAAGTSTLDVHGRLAIHGATHDLTVHDAVYRERSQLTVTSRFTIPYALK